MGRLGGVSQAGIQSIARRLLVSSVDSLAAEAVERVREEEPGYRSSRVTVSDLRHHMGRTLTLALTRLAGDRPDDDLATAAAEVGRLRAEQDLPLDALLHSFRLDLRILWAAAVKEARAGELGADEAHLGAFLLLWEAVEANTSEAVEAYRRTLQDRERSLDALRGLAFDRLVNQGLADTTALREVSRQLAIPVEGRCLVTITAGLPADGYLAVSLGMRLEARGLSGHVGWVGDEFAAVIRLGDRAVESLLSVLEPLSRAHTAAVVVPDLASVALGVRLARGVAAAMAVPEIRLINDRWPEAVLAGSPEVGALLAQEVVEPLFTLPAIERALVLRTLSAYLEGDGSIMNVAAELHCHRNTVRNRLQLVERLTGLSLTRPRDVATLVLAIAWAAGSGGRSDWPG